MQTLVEKVTRADLKIQKLEKMEGDKDNQIQKLNEDKDHYYQSLDNIRDQYNKDIRKFGKQN